MIHEIQIELPPAAVTAHNSGNWHAKSGAVRDYREGTHQLLLVGHRPLIRAGAIPFKVRISHEWFLGKTNIEAQLGGKCPKKWKRYRPADEGNAIQALKPAIDGIVDSGVLFDDKAEYVEWGTFTRHGTAKAHGGNAFVILRLEVLEDRPVQKPTPKEKRKLGVN